MPFPPITNLPSSSFLPHFDPSPSIQERPTFSLDSWPEQLEVLLCLQLELLGLMLVLPRFLLLLWEVQLVEQLIT
jgi:hypothetical protein